MDRRTYGGINGISTRMRLGLAAVATLASVMSLGSLGCRRKAGGSCSGDGAVCAGSATQLMCEGGRYVATACKGPNGCRSDATSVLCDTSGNADGDVCSTQMEGKGSCS